MNINILSYKSFHYFITNNIYTFSIIPEQYNTLEQNTIDIINLYNKIINYYLIMKIHLFIIILINTYILIII